MSRLLLLISLSTISRASILVKRDCPSLRPELMSLDGLWLYISLIRLVDNCSSSGVDGLELSKNGCKVSS